MRVEIGRFDLAQLAGIALMSAEAASFFSGRAVLKMEEVTEMILVGAFRGIHELYRMPKDVEDTGLILYLRSAVKSLGLVEMTELSDPPRRSLQTSERPFGKPKTPVLRYPSLFSPGFLESDNPKI